MKRRIALLLAVLLLASAASCGTTEALSEGTDTQAQTSGEVTTADKFNDNLPDLKFDGRAITFGVSEQSIGDITAEEENGDVVNDAIVARNRAVEERFDVKIETYMVSTDMYKWYEALTTSVLAGDGVCDIAGHYAYYTYKAAQEGIYQDWNTVKYIDQSQPWWISNINDSATINGKLYAITGYLGMSLMDYTTAMFFNTRLLNEYGYKAEDLYKLVYDGKWTFDKFSGIIKDMYADLNGNNEVDDDDFFGYATKSPNALDIWQEAFNIPISSRTKDGKLELDVVSEKRLSALERINSFYKTNSGARLLTNPSATTSWIWYEHFNFASGRQTFVPSIFMAANALYREMNDNCGIVPLPKWDEEQDNYYSNLCDRYYIWGIPMTVTDTDFVGLIAEAMACETLKSVYPAYYDVALKDKFSNDPDTANMVDLVSSGVLFDMSYMFGEYLEFAPYMFRQCIEAGSNDLASKYAAAETKINEGIEQIYSYYK